MLKSKFIKISILAFVVLVALWFAMPGNYSKNFLSHNSSSLSINPEAKIESESEGSNLEEYKKPVFFNIFKFVNNFIPTKQ